MVEAAQLPTASQLRIYFRAPQNAGGGLLNAITKDMLLNHTTDIFRLVGVPSFLAIKHGQIPNKDVYDAWIEDQCNQTDRPEDIHWGGSSYGHVATAVPQVKPKEIQSFHSED